MKKINLVILCAGLFLFQNSCKEIEPEPGNKVSGRLLEECDNPVALSGKFIELWEDARPLNGNDSTKEKFISATQTDDKGLFVFNHDFDSVPMSLRFNDGANGTIYLARGIFGWHNYINTFNNIVADLLVKGNKTKFVFNLETPGGWKNGDSVIFRIDAPNKIGGYSHIYRFGGNRNDTVQDIRAFTRVMENQEKATALDKKFSFPVKADFYLSGSKVSKNYWIPTNTCKGDSLHVFRIKL